MKEYNYFYCIQCTDKVSNQIGCFVFEGNNSFVAISPVFRDLVDLFSWMKGKFISDEYEGNKHILFRVKKISMIYENSF